MTSLDRAFAAMQAEGDENGAAEIARLHYYQRLADSELFVLLAAEATGAAISPKMHEVAQGRFVLGFDTEDRLSEFVGDVAPYAAMSGRVLAQMLGGQGIGMAINLDVAPSSFLIPAEAVAWLNQTLAHVPDRVEARISGIGAPNGLPDGLVSALEAKLAPAAGLVRAVYLVAVTYGDGGKGHMLGFFGVPVAAQDALAKAAGEALTFSGVEAGTMDVGFFAVGDRVAHKLAGVGQRLELPLSEKHKTATRTVPGSDPDKPPILK